MKKHKKAITLVMVLTLLVVALLPTYAMAASATPDWPSLPSGYYGWIKTTSSNGNTRFDSLAEMAIKTAITGGISGWLGVAVAVYDVLQIFSDPGILYYTTEVYQAFNGQGEYMKFSFRKFYKDKNRTQFVTSVQSKVETGIRFSNIEETEAA